MSEHEHVPSPGVVVAVSGTVADELLPAVVIASGPDDLTLAPVSEHAHLASEWDLILPARILGYEAIAQVWNYGSVLSEQVEDVLGDVGNEVRGQLRALVRAAVDGHAPPAGVDVGPPTIADDYPRLVFQEAEAERTRTWWDPALALAGSLTLGQLVAHRRAALAVPSEELESVAAARGWLPALERDELDIRSALPANALAGVMRRLRVGASQRLRRITAYTLETQRGSFDPLSGSALARGGETHASASDVPAIDEYVDAFLDDLRSP